MKKQKLHIALFVFVLLATFITPLVVKGVHHHNTEHQRTEKGVVLSSYEQPCYVCNYEFVSFTLSHEEALTARFFLLRAIQQEISPIRYTAAFTCFSHRGPPVIS